MRRLASHHAGHDPVAREHLDTLPHEHLRIPAARLHHVQEALVAHVAHEQGYLVDVAHDRQQRMLGAAVDAGDGGAEPVHRHVVGEPLAASRHTRAGSLSWPGGPGAVSNLRRTSGAAIAERLAPYDGRIDGNLARRLFAM